MEKDFDDVVRKYYERLREPFVRKLVWKYPKMRLETARDIYQEAFIAVQKNIQQGKVRPNTNWNDYILAICFNLASKDARHADITVAYEQNTGENSNDSIARKVEDIIKELPEEEVAFCNNIDVLATLGDELKHTPGLCGKIIQLFYYAGASMEEIAEETGLKNAQTAKAKKNQCMSDLIHRVTDALRRAGFDVTPKKRNKNGKN